MSGHDEDIDFDFFGDSEPEPPKRRLVRRPSGPPPGEPPPPRRPGGHANPPATPIVRLVSLIVFAIAMILILVFAVRSCETSNESAAYKDYMSRVAKIAVDSKNVGAQLKTLLENQNVNESQLEAKLQGLVEQHNLDVKEGSALTPPGPLRQQQEKLVEALQLRSDGLKGLLDVFKATAAKHGSTAVTQSGHQLSEQMYKIVASDVIWADMFAAPAVNVLKDQGVAGVSPPTSVFISDPDRASTNSMGAVWQRIHGIAVTTNPAGGSNRHGTGIAYFKITPSNETLQEGVTKTITLKGNLGFVVGVSNTGDYQEENVKVKLTIHQNAPAKSIVRESTIPQIFSNTTKDVFFKGPFELTTMITVVPIRVQVVPVPNEASLANNTATYDVRFSF